MSSFTTSYTNTALEVLDGHLPPLASAYADREVFDKVHIRAFPTWIYNTLSMIGQRPIKELILVVREPEAKEWPAVVKALAAANIEYLEILEESSVFTIEHLRLLLTEAPNITRMRLGLCSMNLEGAAQLEGLKTSVTHFSCTGLGSRVDGLPFWQNILRAMPMLTHLCMNVFNVGSTFGEVLVEHARQHGVFKDLHFCCGFNRVESSISSNSLGAIIKYSPELERLSYKTGRTTDAEFYGAAFEVARSQSIRVFEFECDALIQHMVRAPSLKIFDETSRLEKFAFIAHHADGLTGCETILHSVCAIEGLKSLTWHTRERFTHSMWSDVRMRCSQNLTELDVEQNSSIGHVVHNLSSCTALRVVRIRGSGSSLPQIIIGSPVEELRLEGMRPQAVHAILSSLTQPESLRQLKVLPKYSKRDLLPPTDDDTLFHANHMWSELPRFSSLRKLTLALSSLAVLPVDNLKEVFKLSVIFKDDNMRFINIFFAIDALPALKHLDLGYQSTTSTKPHPSLSTGQNECLRQIVKRGTIIHISSNLGVDKDISEQALLNRK